MTNIKNIQQDYQKKISPLDLEILISHVIKKSREFVLAHPEYKLWPYQVLRIKYYVWQRSKKKPIAYIIGHKEFYGLDFKVNKNVLIPRPETEQIVELVVRNLKSAIGKNKKIVIKDIGTGSGNIIVSLARWLKKSELRMANYKFLASDISSNALRIARKNARIHKVDREIKFLRGDLLKPFLDLKDRKTMKPALVKRHDMEYIILANLPYLSKEIYNSTSINVRNYEPKNALYSQKSGLSHYNKLFKQINFLIINHRLPITIFLEFSPEQKTEITKLIRKYFLYSKVKLKKDLTGKWRICQIKILS